MKRLGDLMHETPNATQAEAMVYVLEVALAWQRGELSLDAVQGLCTGYERWQATRFADPKSEGYAALRNLVEHLVGGDPTVLRTVHGTINSDERFTGGVTSMTNWRDKRVLVWPLCWINDEPHYPPVHLPPGAERREIELVIQKRYDAYRDAKRKARRT